MLPSTNCYIFVILWLSGGYRLNMFRAYHSVSCTAINHELQLLPFLYLLVYTFKDSTLTSPSEDVVTSS